MKKKTKSEAGKMGALVTWAKRMAIIDKLHEFGGVQPNYRKWKTKHLEILLKAWQKSQSQII